MTVEKVDALVCGHGMSEKCRISCHLVTPRRLERLKMGLCGRDRGMLVHYGVWDPSLRVSCTQILLLCIFLSFLLRG